MESQYDKRIVDVEDPPIGYNKYLKGLKCCCCRSVKGCNCTASEFIHSKVSYRSTTQRRPNRQGQ